MNFMYMHSYTKDSKLHLFLASVNGNTKSSLCSFIYKENNFTIKILLDRNKSGINIEIDRNSEINTSNKNLEKISFIDGEYELKDKYDEEKFRTIISCIMNGVKELINYYFNNKRF